MGVLSPAAYDALLLEKVKLLLQGAMHSPRRRGPPSTYEAFVEGLDIRDDSSIRAFEVLLYETTTRRALYKRTNAGPVASTSTAGNAGTSARRRRTSLSDAAFAVPPHTAFGRHVFDESDDSEETDSSESDDIRPLRRALRPAGIRAVDSFHDATDEARAVRAQDATPTAQARHEAVDELFGTPDTLPLLSRPASSTTLPGGATFPIPPPGVVMPTFEELWTILTEEPFPSSRITSFSTMLAELNSFYFVPETLIVRNMRELLNELVRRDPAVLLGVANAMMARASGAGVETRPARRGSPLRQRTLLDMRAWSARHGSPGEGAPEADPAAPALGTDDSPLREGIWRTSFVEHLGDGAARETEVDLGGLPDTREAASFAGYTQQLRAQRRRAAQPAHAPDAAPFGAGIGMDVDRPAVEAFGSTLTTTPAIVMTSASTPATSVPHSPPASSAAACLAPIPVAQPRTSASIAEAHFRSQRRVVPLRSTPESNTTALTARAGAQEGAAAGVHPSMHAVVEALQRARDRRSLPPSPEPDVMR